MPNALIADELETALGKHFKAIPQVRLILTERVDGALRVRIAVNNPEASVRKRIYEAELDQIDGLLSRISTLICVLLRPRRSGTLRGCS
jgi:hypothetical protein